MADVGRTLAGSRLGRWRLEVELGSGATARVFSARHVEMARPAAVKVLHAERALDPVARERLAREADAVARVRHPNVVPILDAGVDDGVAYVVMDLIEGPTLATLLARDGPLEPRRAARLGRAIASGLEAVHACGVIHRDVKPSNVVVLDGAEGDRPVLVDFGVAGFADPSSEALTRQGELIGTPRYMSPEQGAGLALDARADVYALGVVLYECLTGRCPYEGPTWQATLLAASRGRCPSIRSLRPVVSVAIERVVRRAMAPQREARYPSAAAMRDALDASLGAPKAAWWPAPVAACACVALAAATMHARGHAPLAGTAHGAVPAPARSAPEAPPGERALPPAVMPSATPARQAPTKAAATPRRPLRREERLARRGDAASSRDAGGAAGSTRVLGRGAHGAWILAPLDDETDPR